jgi:hypothetical protein
MNHHAAGSQTGKNHDPDADADAPHATSTANGTTNGSIPPPKDMEIEHQHDDRPEVTMQTRDELATGDAQDGKLANCDTVADEPAKDDDDENGEDVVEEAAEDTVIY